MATEGPLIRPFGPPSPQGEKGPLLLVLEQPLVRRHLQDRLGRDRKRCIAGSYPRPWSLPRLLHSPLAVRRLPTPGWSTPSPSPPASPIHGQVWTICWR